MAASYKGQYISLTMKKANKISMSAYTLPCCSFMALEPSRAQSLIGEIIEPAGELGPVRGSPWACVTLKIYGGGTVKS